jgi:hypothetical protein
MQTPDVIDYNSKFLVVGLSPRNKNKRKAERPDQSATLPAKLSPSSRETDNSLLQVSYDTEPVKPAVELPQIIS